MLRVLMKRRKFGCRHTERRRPHEDRSTDAHREEAHVKTEIETGMMHL